MLPTVETLKPRSFLIVMTYLFAVRENSCWQKHPQLRRNHSYQIWGEIFFTKFLEIFFKVNFIMMYQISLPFIVLLKLSYVL